MSFVYIRSTPKMSFLDAHPMNILTKYCFNWPNGLKKRLKTDNTLFDSFLDLVSFKYFRSTTKKNHNFFRGSSNEHSYKVWFQLNWSSGFRKEDLNQTTPFLTHLKCRRSCLQTFVMGGGGQHKKVCPPEGWEIINSFLLLIQHKLLILSNISQLMSPLFFYCDRITLIMQC